MAGRRRKVQDAAGEDGSGSRSVRRALEIFELMLQRGEPLTVTDLVPHLAARDSRVRAAAVALSAVVRGAA